jgi:nicotinamidase-related amidase
MRRTALLIIDVQNDFVLPGSPASIPEAERVVPAIVRLRDFFRQNGGLVMYIVRAYRPDGSDVEAFRLPGFRAGRKLVVAGTPGAEIVEALKPAADEPVIVKKRFSAFLKTELDLLLRRRRITALIICGVQYPNCIRATVYDAVSLDYAVTVITDATVGEDRDVCESNIWDMRNIGVDCLPLSEFLDRRKV